MTECSNSLVAVFMQIKKQLICIGVRIC